MKVASVLLLGAALSLRCPASLIVDNGGPDNISAFNITAFRVADDFIMPSGHAVTNTIQPLRFSLTPGNGNPVSDFSGTITYAFYNSTVDGNIGSFLAAGTVSGLRSHATNGNLPVCNLSPHCPVQRVDFDLPASITLGAGKYWLELHEG